MRYVWESIKAFVGLLGAGLLVVGIMMLAIALAVHDTNEEFARASEDTVLLDLSDDRGEAMISTCIMMLYEMPFDHPVMREPRMHSTWRSTSRLKEFAKRIKKDGQVVLSASDHPEFSKLLTAFQFMYGPLNCSEEIIIDLRVRGKSYWRLVP
jgi:hypothetical protein